MRKGNIIAADVFLADITLQLPLIALLPLILISRLRRVPPLRTLLSIFAAIRRLHICHVVSAAGVSGLREFSVVGAVHLD